MDKLYLRVRLSNGDERHLLCRPQPNGASSEWDELAHTHIHAFIDGTGDHSAEWLTTAEGTWVARGEIVEVTPVRVNADRPPWMQWTQADDRVLPPT